MFSRLAFLYQLVYSDIENTLRLLLNTTLMRSTVLSLPLQFVSWSRPWVGQLKLFGSSFCHFERRWQRNGFVTLATGRRVVHRPPRLRRSVGSARRGGNGPT